MDRRPEQPTLHPDASIERVSDLRGYPLLHKNVRGKSKVLAKFSCLLQSELALPREEQGECTLRSEFRNKVALCEVLMSAGKSHRYALKPG